MIEIAKLDFTDLQKKGHCFSKDNKQAFNVEVINLSTRIADKMQKIGIIEGPDEYNKFN